MKHTIFKYSAIFILGIMCQNLIDVSRAQAKRIEQERLCADAERDGLLMDRCFEGVSYE